MFWINSSGQLIVNDSGQPIDCAVCPCTVGPGGPFSVVNGLVGAVITNCSIAPNNCTPADTVVVNGVYTLVFGIQIIGSTLYSGWIGQIGGGNWAVMSCVGIGSLSHWQLQIVNSAGTVIATYTTTGCFPMTFN